MSFNSPSAATPRSIHQIPLSYSNADPNASALRLVLTLFPAWEHEEGQIEFIHFTDGITNTLLKAIKRRPGSTLESLDNEAVLLRAYGKGTEILIDREKETISHSLLAQHNLAPALLARFQNGLIYKFIRGQVCTPQDLRRESVWRAVAARLAQWHAILPVVSSNGRAVVQNAGPEVSLAAFSSSFSPLLKAINAIAPGKPAPNVWTIMQKWAFALPTSTEAESRRKQKLQQELRFVVSELGDVRGLGEDGLVFGHTDLLSGNVIIQPDTVAGRNPKVERVAFIDYEYAVPCPVAFDIANHFAEWGGFGCDYSVLPTKSVRHEFIKEYMRSFASHNRMIVPEDHIDQILEEVDLFRGVPGLYWGIWALIQATISQIDFDYATYAEVRLGEYWAWKAERDGSRMRAGKEMPLRERRWAEE